MISDVLFEAVKEIDRYLDEEEDLYTGAIRKRIVRIRDEMDELREELDILSEHKR